MGDLVIGLAATKAQWSTAFRSYVRDHTQGITVEVLMDRFSLTRATPRLDALVVDDVMRTFSASEIAGAQQVGLHVVGLYDGTTGMGRQYLVDLGVDVALPAATPAADLVAHILERRPRRPSGPASGHRIGPAGGATEWRSRGRRALVSAWTKVSGGAGLSEMIVAAAEHLGKREHVLVIEADEVAPVLASRLLRSPDPGLAWAVSRTAQGLKVLPEGLSGSRGDGTVAIGSFDVICGTAGAAQVIPAADLLRMVDEAASTYDHVLVETSWLVGAPSSRERFSATRAVLGTADRTVVLASADPEGAARLVEWRAAALAAGCKGPGWAAFGRARASRYERGHLADLLRANTGRHPFEDVWFLPEDATVARARWNAEMVWKGPWLKSARALTDAVVAKGAAPRRSAPRRPLAGPTQITEQPTEMVAL
jgi:hypothetical protein